MFHTSAHRKKVKKLQVTKWIHTNLTSYTSRSYPIV